jgi:hypothetical protein
VDDYLNLLDVEYPAFSRKMCYLLRELAARGKRIVQVEPFLEILLGIHEFFAQGHRPQELDKNAIHYPVYLAEHHATRTLLAYYQTVMTESFEKALEAVEQFARGCKALSITRFAACPRNGATFQAVSVCIYRGRGHSSVIVAIVAAADLAAGPVAIDIFSRRCPQKAGNQRAYIWTGRPADAAVYLPSKSHHNETNKDAGCQIHHLFENH